MAKRRELEAPIDEAIRTSAFTLVYQPIVVPGSDEMVGVVALVRWPHPRWGCSTPTSSSRWPKTGQVVPLGSWVLRQAVADIVRQQRRLPRQPPLYVSINVQVAPPFGVFEVRSTTAPVYRRYRGTVEFSTGPPHSH